MTTTRTSTVVRVVMRPRAPETMRRHFVEGGCTGSWPPPIPISGVATAVLAVGLGSRNARIDPLADHRARTRRTRPSSETFGWNGLSSHVIAKSPMRFRNRRDTGHTETKTMGSVFDARSRS